MSDFLDLPDLVDQRVGGEVLVANDEFFAPKENLIKPGDPVWLADEFTERGKWMDGWETRRRREPGHDWVILRLGLPGEVHGVVVDTTHFRGNYPESCSMDACAVPEDTSIDALLACHDQSGGQPDSQSDSQSGGQPDSQSGIEWREILPQTVLEGHTKNVFVIGDRSRVTHVRLNIYPDGGVARVRVHGRVLADWERIDARGELVDLAAIAHGGRALACSDECFGPAANLLMPGTARNSGDGWETRRRRGEGHDWAILQLGSPGVIETASVDTSHFIGNAPGTCVLEWCSAAEDVPLLSLKSPTCPWRPLLPETKLTPNHVHEFDKQLLPTDNATHIRFSIHPDGGVARLRLFGRSTRSRALHAGLRVLNAAVDEHCHADMMACCAAPDWAALMAESRPFESVHALLARADQAWAGLDHDAWRTAFAAHPRIGEAHGKEGRFARWSEDEQSAVDRTRDDILAQLSQADTAYHERFGHVFIVFASNKSADEILSILRERLRAQPENEIKVAAREQAKITRARLHKLLLGLADAEHDGA